MTQDEQKTYNPSTPFDSIPEILSQIAKKYGLDEPKSVAVDKVRQGKLPKLSFIVKISAEYSRREISDKDSVNSIMENLGLAEGNAKQIFLDIKEMLIPALKKIPWPDEDGGSKVKPTGIEEKIPQQETSVSQKLGIPLPPDNQEKIERIKKVKKNQEIQKNINQKSGPDAYREQIE